MKKRNIIIISLSIISLVFGGLVFLGVSTFPELLEEEKKEIEHPSNDVLLNVPSNDNKKSEEVTVVVSSNGASNYVADTVKSSNTSHRLSSSYNYEIIHHVDNASLTVKETPATNKEIVSEATNEVNAPSTYYKGKSYVSLKRERDNKNLSVKQKLDNSEIIKNRNKNIVNTIVLVVVAIEALAFIFLNKKRHSHKAQMPHR